MGAYTTVYKDIRVTNESTYDLFLRIDNKLFHREFSNISDLFNFCKEMELRAVLDIDKTTVKKWSDD